MVSSPRLKAGAKADVTRWNGETALMIAAGSGTVDAVRQLVLHGADVNASDPRRGQTALMWAAAEGHTEVVSALVEIGANVKAVSKNGFSALVFSTTKNDVSSIKTLNFFPRVSTRTRERHDRGRPARAVEAEVSALVPAESRRR
jgi:ankyrin repeat protein